MDWVYMVHCVKCGADNRDDAQYCIQCGASLYPTRVRDEKYEKRESDICFGIGQSVRYFWLIFGILIMLWGISQLLKVYYRITLEIWPLVLIVLGLFLVYRSLTQSFRK